MDIEQIRKDFPMFKNNSNLIYFDNAATTFKPSCVLDKIQEYYTHFGVSVHRGTYNLSVAAEHMFEDTRAEVARFINSETSEIIFTANASYALNSVALMIKDTLNSGDHILSSPLEHHSALLPYQNMEQEKGCVLDYINLLPDGRVDMSNFNKLITNNVKVVIVSLVSNTMGYYLDVKQICSIAHKKGAIVIVDMTQGISYYNVDVKKMDCDFAVFSAHKLLGPTGVGVMYGKHKYLEKMSPVFYGGEMIQSVSYHFSKLAPIPYKYEVGTPNIAGVIAFGEAIRYINSIGKDAIHEREQELKNYLIQELSKIQGITIYNMTCDTPIVNFNIDGVPSHDASTFYDSYNVAIRAGQHCAALVTNFLGVNATLRASLYFYNTKEEIDKFIIASKKIVKFFSENK
ncbi:MAG: aminotransferase class V-fold PLP-dependent enzyme [Bacilli bacterium]